MLSTSKKRSSARKKSRTDSKATKKSTRRRRTSRRKSGDGESTGSSEKLPVRKPGRKFRSFAFYGRSGTGKTTLAGSFPGKILLLDVKDQGDDSVSDLSEEIDVMDVGTWEDYEQAYWYLKSHPSEYATVVIDTATQLQHIVIQKILTEKNKDTERAGDWGTMTKREWAEVAAVMKTWITNFRDLEMNVVFIAQDRVFSVDEEDQDDDERITPEVGVALSPSVAKHLNASVSVIGNTFIREHVRLKKVKGKKKPEEVVDIQFCLRIGPNPVYTTKIRKPKEILLPDTLVDPTYEDIMEIIKGA